ncbi:MAG: efflux RND transporter permease subunit, partial [Fibrobacterales bacterium]
MTITKYVLDKSRVTLVTLAALIILGLVSYKNMAREDMPPFTIRVASAVTSFPGASPERVESMVTEVIEKELQSIPEIKSITSESRTGLSIVKIQLKQDVQELQPIWDKVRRKINSVTFAEGVKKTNLKDEGVGDVYGIVLALESDGFSTLELHEYAEELEQDIIRIPDAASVRIQGVQ